MSTRSQHARHALPEVIVVGAGPGGASAAYHLARCGRKVLLVDRDRFPRDKSCGDGLTRFAAGHLTDMGVLDRLDGAHVVRGARIHMRGRGSRDFQYPGGPTEPGGGRVVKRIELDDAICRRAVAAGAELWEETLVTRLRREQDGRVAIELRRNGETGTIVAPAVVIASGAASRLAARFGFERAEPKDLGFAIRGYYEDLRGLSDLLEVYTPLLDSSDKDLLPSYGWVFPTGPTSANIGVGLFERASNANVRELFKRFLDSLRKDDARFANARACGTWNGAALRFDFSPEHCAAPGVVLVGDAAGLISPFTGEGIGYALESGKLAAEVIDRNLRTHDRGPLEFREYAAALARRYAGYFETGRESAKRYHLVWHLIESTFRNEQPLFALCRNAVLFPEGLGESYADALLDNVGPYVQQQSLPVQADLLAVDELLVGILRGDWAFLAHALGQLRSDRSVGFRPALLLLLASYFGAPRRPAVFLAAAAVELGALAGVAHLSVEEESGDSHRAGLPNINWGNRTALLVGDFLLSKAHELGAVLGTATNRAIAASLGRTCEGWVRDIRNTGNLRLSRTEYIEIVERKLSSCFELPLTLGATLGGLSPAQTAALGRYGRFLGLSFELREQTMLCVGNPSKGVWAAGPKDGMHGFPVLLALEAEGAASGRLRELLEANDAQRMKASASPRRDADSTLRAGSDTAAVYRLVAETDALAETLKLARDYARRAADSLGTLPQGPAREALARLAVYVVDRAPARSSS